MASTLALERLDSEGLRELGMALDAAGLRSHDINEPGYRFYRLEVSKGVAGYAGVELYGNDALLRSVVVPTKGRGIGRRVVEAVIEEARSLGVERFWLLTETAEGFFARMGFARIDRSAAPASIAETEQFSSLCAASAAFMMRKIR